MDTNQHPKVVLVTGASRGIGRAIADELVQSGALVIDASIDSPTAAVPIVPGQPLQHVRVDISDEPAVLDLFATIDRVYGRLDALVNNAGIGVFKPLADLSLAEWNGVFQANVTGAFLCTREAIKRMTPQGGRIINIGSIADHIPLPENGAYGASKAALRMLTQVTNEEYKAKNIRATLLCLGAVYTELWENRPGFNRADMLSVADVARTVAETISRPLHVRLDEIQLLPPRGVL